MFFAAFLFLSTIAIFQGQGQSQQQQEDPSVTRFREYLQINSAHPVPDYGIYKRFAKSVTYLISIQFSFFF